MEASLFINTFLIYCNNYLLQRQAEMAEYEIRKESARKLYWDACKLPRKKKKKVRKQAHSDFQFYSMMSSF